MAGADPFLVDIRVVPRASQNSIDGALREGRIVIRVTAPPVDGAATAAALSVLADGLGLAPKMIQLTAGETSRNKRVRISGLRASEVLERLAIVPDRAVGSTERRARDRRANDSHRPKNR